MCYITFNILFFVAMLIFWVYCKLSIGICKCSKHLVGKVVIVTGGCSGIGYETAKDLAERGARVILADVNERFGADVRDEIIASTGNNDVHYHCLDLASIKSIREFAADILKKEKYLHVLINNAGIFGSKNVKTEDGLLLGMQVNYFGPFLLTHLLLTLLKSSTPSRIVNVSSIAHCFGTIDLENLNMEKETKETGKTRKVYANTKLCIILMTLELGRRLKGSGVTANCLHPGVTVTDMAKSTDVAIIKYSLPLLQLFWKTKWEAAQTSLYLAVSSEVVNVNGKYFVDCSEAKAFGQQACDMELAHKLWTASERILGIINYESPNRTET